MADVPIYTRKRTARPVGRAPLPRSAAHTGNEAVYEGFQRLGFGIEDIGKILLQHEKEQISLQDTINEVKFNSYIESERNTFGDYINKNDLVITKNTPSNWERESEKSITKLSQTINKLPFSKNARRIMLAKLGAVSDLRKVNLKVTQSKILSEKAKAFLPQNVEDAIESGNRTNIANALGTFKTGRENAWGAEQHIAEEVLKKAKRDGMIKRIRNAAVLDPETVIENIEVELEQRKKTGKGEGDFGEYLPDESDLQSLKNYAQSILNKKVSESERLVNKSIVESYGLIRNGETDIDGMIDRIEADGNITDEDKIKAAEKIRIFFSTWNSAVDEKVVTKDSTRIKVNNVINKVRRGNMSLDNAIDTYTVISKVEKINSNDSKSFIDKIYAASETAEKYTAKRREDMISRREEQLRDSIQTQYSLFPPEDIDEILEDFANEAVIVLRDKYDEKDYRDLSDKDFKTQLDSDIDTLMKKYKLSEAQQLRAVSARQFEIAENFKQQQDAVVKLIAALKQEKRNEEAKAVTDEAIRLGLLDIEGKRGDITKPKKGEKVDKIDVLKRILEAL